MSVCLCCKVILYSVGLVILNSVEILVESVIVCSLVFLVWSVIVKYVLFFEMLCVNDVGKYNDFLLIVLNVDIMYGIIGLCMLVVIMNGRILVNNVVVI